MIEDKWVHTVIIDEAAIKRHNEHQKKVLDAFFEQVSLHSVHIPIYSKEGNQNAFNECIKRYKE